MFEVLSGLWSDFVDLPLWVAAPLLLVPIWFVASLFLQVLRQGALHLLSIARGRPRFLKGEKDRSLSSLHQRGGASYYLTVTAAIPMRILDALVRRDVWIAAVLVGLLLASEEATEAGVTMVDWARARSLSEWASVANISTALILAVTIFLVSGPRQRMDRSISALGRKRSSVAIAALSPKYSMLADQLERFGPVLLNYGPNHRATEDLQAALTATLSDIDWIAAEASNGGLQYPIHQALRPHIAASSASGVLAGRCGQVFLAGVPIPRPSESLRTLIGVPSDLMLDPSDAPQELSQKDKKWVQERVIAINWAARDLRQVSRSITRVLGQGKWTDRLSSAR